MKLVVTVLLAAALMGCAHIDVIHDKSTTLERSAVLGIIQSIAIMPIQEDTGIPGLSSRMETELAKSLQTQFPSTELLDAQTVSSRFASADLITMYGQWRAGYEFTGIVDPRTFQSISNAIAAKYVMVVHPPQLSREKLRANDAGYAGLMGDSNEVWRTDLEFAAELIDASSRSIAWKGSGHAEYIRSPGKDSDSFLVVTNDRNPEIPEYLGRLVTAAAQGLAHQLGQAVDSTLTAADPPPPTPHEQAPSSYVSVTIPANSARATQSTIVIPTAPTAMTRCPALGVDLTKLTVTSLGGVDGLTGTMVLAVVPHSPAENADIRQGDILVRIGDAGINEPADVLDAVARIVPGSVTPVKLTRQARSFWVNVKF